MDSLDNTKTVLIGNINNEYLNFKDAIIKSLNEELKHSLYLNFLDKFFACMPEDYVKEHKIDDFIHLSQNAFEFFKNSHLKFPSIEVNETKNGTNIFILNKNMPFIIDSILSLLYENNISVSLLFHPVIYSKRDENGVLNLIENNSDESNSECSESLVVLEVDKKFDSESSESLKTAILKVLKTVSITCNSWDSILTKIDEFKNNIDIQNDKQRELNDFLDWLKNHNFTFFGLIEYDQNNKINLLIGSQDSWRHEDNQINDIIKYSREGISAEKALVFGAVNTLSSINRNRVISYILIKKFDKNNKYIGGMLLLGLYGSGLQYQSVENIPVVKYKLNQIIDRSGFSKNGYNVKKIKLILESLPREPLFEIDQDELYSMAMHILSAMATKSFKLFTYNSLSKQFINILIFLPSDRITPITHMKIINYFINNLKCKIIGDNVKEIVEGYSYLKLNIKIPKSAKNILNYENIEIDLDNISRLWKDSLIKEINKSQDLKYSKSILKEYAEILPYNYQNKFGANIALKDIRYLIDLLTTNHNIFKLINNVNGSYTLKIYSKTEIHLSSIIPIIECLGFKAIDEEKFDIQDVYNHKLQICVFNLDGPVIKSDSLESVFEKIEEALYRISDGVMPRDDLCKLIIYSEFTWREVMIVKGLTSYLRQTGAVYDYVDVQSALIKHSSFAKNLFNLFDEKLNPDNPGTNIKNIRSSLSKYLLSVSSASEDKILNSMLSIVESILRTNNYQKIDGNHKDYISFKIDSHKVKDLPLPRPLFEIFVYSNDFEAIHLRGGKVARGGIRWSDRGSDYRTEVLGLMKAQMTKNTVIVPVGSKGGFFVKKDLSGLDRKSFMQEIVNCYQNFLRGLLDITDNIVGKEIVSPKDTKSLDIQDPYLVVAADKGTASFSDFANAVSKEYNFWLGDAFASGGSAGYDHKKLAITARGAWIAVERHFMEMGIDVQADSITIVGIGDMSGDVFGNGLLRSNKVKLVAAFNHKHIFIDPEPDPLISFEERDRLFALPSSNWTDYKSELISKGGGVFERSAKTINLSKEAQSLFNISTNIVAPEELIKYILKANVDLIWNGGIGTYIKASSENHADIGDKSNDNLRVNGKEVRAKVIGEGGNLGISQFGRIEYSQIGGRINTDFIDNSGGVGCSDAEVNIKIALSEAVKLGKITLEERNSLLKKMTDQVAAKVLQANIEQTLALTIFEKSNAFTLEMFSKLINNLEQYHGLDRKVEFLPSSEELADRSKKGQGLTRPELCVLLAYSKISVSNQLEQTNFADDPYLEKYLVEYFPKQMREKFLQEILSHQLRKEIINTVVTNKIINQLTGTVVNTIQEQTGANIVDIVKYYIVILSMFKIDELWEEIESLPASFNIDIKISMLSEINKLIRRGICWLITNHKEKSSIQDLINKYDKPVQEIISLVSKSLYGTAKDKYNLKMKNFIDNSISKNLAHKISALDSFISVFDIIVIKKAVNVDPQNIAKIYFLVGDKLYLDLLRKIAESLIDDSYWNRLAVQSIKDDIYDIQRTVISIIIQATHNLTEPFDNWFERNKGKLAAYLTFVENMNMQENININIVILASKKIRNYLKDYISINQ